MEASPLEKSSSETENVEIINIDFDIETLIVTVVMDGCKIDIYFDDPAGYRVMDEGNLLEFWPTCSLNNGWLYEINYGCWLEQESKREGFLLSDNDDVKEYFVIGVNYCINVLAWENPRVEESIR